MSCHGCLKKFTFFTREHGCPNCGFSYCSKCLKERVTLGSEEKNVCRACQKKLTSSSESKMASSDLDPPDLLVKRLETLENPAKPPITVFRHSNRLMNLKSGLSEQDKEILERLERLKAERTANILPDEDEIKRRLALLQDRSVESVSSASDKPSYAKLSAVKKTEQEEVDELLKMYTDETGLDADLETAGNKQMDDIEARLRRLQTGGAPASQTSNEGEAEDEEAITARIIKRAIAEGRLERKLEQSMGEQGGDTDDLDMSDCTESDEDPEFTWCCICNEDAAVKCYGCDGSLYCNTCFKQGHEFFNMEDHKFVPFEGKGSAS